MNPAHMLRRFPWSRLTPNCPAQIAEPAPLARPVNAAQRLTIYKATLGFLGPIAYHGQVDDAEGLARVLQRYLAAYRLTLTGQEYRPENVGTRFPVLCHGDPLKPGAVQFFAVWEAAR